MNMQKLMKEAQKAQKRCKKRRSGSRIYLLPAARAAAW